MNWYDTNLVLIQATLTGIVLALSVQVPMRFGVFSFAGVGAFAVGAYGTAVLTVDHGQGPVMAILLMALVSAVLVLLLGAIVSHLGGLTLAMATVAFNLILGVVALNAKEWTGGATGRYGVLVDFGANEVWIVTAVVVTLVAATEMGKLGRRTVVVREDPDLAASLGIKVRRYRLAAFAASGALGSVAGSMTIMVRTAITPTDVGFHLTVTALTMIILGGALSWRGAVIGAVLVTWLPEVLLFIGMWQELVYGALVVLAAVLAPRGIYGLFIEARRAWQMRSRRDHVQAEQAGAVPQLAVDQ